jgi:hypothetical protein
MAVKRQVEPKSSSKPSVTDHNVDNVPGSYQPITQVDEPDSYADHTPLAEDESGMEGPTNPIGKPRKNAGK